MEERALKREPCSVAQTIEIVGERWSLLVLREAFFGVRRFDQFQRNLGIARNILAARLHTLVDHEILERRLYQERPERYEYRLTQKGLDLYPALVSLMRWGDEHVHADPGPPVVLIHKACGHDAAPHLACAHCGERIGPHDIRAEVGPGALASTA